LFFNKTNELATKAKPMLTAIQSEHSTGIPKSTTVVEQHQLGSFSPVDAVTIIYIPEVKVHAILPNLSMITYSIHREKKQVVPLGRSYPKYICKGSRTIAGSLEFVVNRQGDPFLDIVSSISIDSDYGFSYSPLSDQIPPFDVVVIYMDEYGHSAFLRLYGVEFIDEGLVNSINDVVVTNNRSFIARDIDLLCPVGQQKFYYNDSTGKYEKKLFTTKAENEHNSLINMLTQKSLLELSNKRLEMANEGKEGFISKYGSLSIYKYDDKNNRVIISQLNQIDQNTISGIINTNNLYIAELTSLIENYTSTFNLPYDKLGLPFSDFRRELINYGYVHGDYGSMGRIEFENVQPVNINPTKEGDFPINNSYIA